LILIALLCVNVTNRLFFANHVKSLVSPAEVARPCYGRKR
jgi:hypothetical protein